MVDRRKIALFGIYLSLYTNSLMITVMTPIANKMVMYFGMVDDRTKTGYWVGFLTGSITLGRFASSYHWGTLCDKYGTKPMQILGIITTIILTILFGLSSSFYMAILLRFLQGLLSPLTITTKTLISELYPSKEQASAMSWFIVVNSFGSISGNIIGGYLEDPQNYNIWLFNQFPFLLPNLIISLIGLISLIICYLYLDDMQFSESLLNTDNPRSFCNLIKDPLVKQALFIYFICSCNGAGFSELLVLWVWAKKENGGFEFTPDEIGTMSAITICLCMIYIRHIYKILVDSFGLMNSSKYCLQINFIVMLLIPLITFTRFTEILKWVLLIFGSLIYYSLDFVSITNSLIYINNSVKANERGKLNGISLAIASIGRGLFTPIYDIIFAATAESEYYYPLNFAFAFIILSVSILITSIFVRSASKELEHGRDEKIDKE
ncbi:hypothetical protein SteCoe_7736 [Stentor coeruleus]|uniref:Major facilitator superfamily (MFS) profile domain-containing protein n=1 Tax=Stentor coeruleus TaxID=5963 RepID=A0A1R2CLT7_9CILI|nr:hypothetical protein SteCoe_7736 [Stentor coeruleus]